MAALEKAIIDADLRARMVAIADDALSLVAAAPVSLRSTDDSTVLVFQYGSNTSSARFNHPSRLNGDARDLGLVRTAGLFELDFDVWSKQNQCFAADIREGQGRQIWGVLYGVPEFLIRRDTAQARGRKSLDAIEGRLYRRSDIRVERPDGTPVEERVITYTVIAPTETQQTSLEYATHILTGLREHNAPADDIGYVKERIRRSNPSLVENIETI